MTATNVQDSSISMSTDEEEDFDPENFIADVTNSVIDFTIEGFNYLEEFAAQSLELESADSRRALKHGVDRVYSKVQDNVDESLSQWESRCRDNYFNFSANSPGISKSKSKSSRKYGEIRKDTKVSISSISTGVDRSKEDALDKELGSLQAQLLVARRDGARMRKEIIFLEKEVLRQSKVMAGEKSLGDAIDSALFEDCLKTASVLQDTIHKASTLRDGEVLQAGSSDDILHLLS